MQKNTGVVTPQAQPDRRVRRPLSEGESRGPFGPVGNKAGMGGRFDQRKHTAGRRCSQGDDVRGQEGHGATSRADAALAHGLRVRRGQRAERRSLISRGPLGDMVVVVMGCRSKRRVMPTHVRVTCVIVFAIEGLRGAVVPRTAQQHRRRSEALRGKCKNQQAHDETAHRARHGCKSSAGCREKHPREVPARIRTQGMVRFMAPWSAIALPM